MECVKCTYLDLKTGDYYGKFYCDKKYERHYPLDNACGSFTKAYSRSNGEIRNAIDFYNSKTSSCYITTMLCNILKLSDSNYYLNTLRNFRNNYLIKDYKYKNILIEYDIIGPVIANMLIDDSKKSFVAARMFYNYIQPIVSLIKDHMYVDAINSYKMMINILKKRYDINLIPTIDQIENGDIEKSGHGSYVKMKKM